MRKARDAKKRAVTVIKNQLERELLTSDEDSDDFIKPQEKPPSPSISKREINFDEDVDLHIDYPNELNFLRENPKRITNDLNNFENLSLIEDKSEPSANQFLLSEENKNLQIEGSGSGPKNPIKNMADFNKITKNLIKYNGSHSELARFISSNEHALAIDPTINDPENAGLKKNVLNHILINNLDKKTYQAVKDKTFNTLDELHKLIRDSVLKSIDHENIITKIYNSRQKPNESIESFSERILVLKEQHADLFSSNIVDDNESIKKYNNSLICQAFVRGCLPPLRNILLARDFTTLQDAIDYALKKELTLKQLHLNNEQNFNQNKYQQNFQRRFSNDYNKYPNFGNNFRNNFHPNINRYNNYNRNPQANRNNPFNKIDFNSNNNNLFNQKNYQPNTDQAFNENETKKDSGTEENKIQINEKVNENSNFKYSNFRPYRNQNLANNGYNRYENMDQNKKTFMTSAVTNNQYKKN